MRGQRSVNYGTGIQLSMWLVALTRAACSLNACSLWPWCVLVGGAHPMLVACDLEKVQRPRNLLMFTVCNVFHLRIPTRSTVTASVALFWSWTSRAFSYYSRCIRPGSAGFLVNHRHGKSNH